MLCRAFVCLSVSNFTLKTTEWIFTTIFTANVIVYNEVLVEFWYSARCSARIRICRLQIQTRFTLAEVRTLRLLLSASWSSTQHVILWCLVCLCTGLSSVRLVAGTMARYQPFWWRQRQRVEVRMFVLPLDKVLFCIRIRIEYVLSLIHI